MWKRVAKELLRAGQQPWHEHLPQEAPAHRERTPSSRSGSVEHPIRHLPNPRLRAAPPSVPVLVDERADAGRGARVARELHGVLHVSKRLQDEDGHGPVGPRHRPRLRPASGRRRARPLYGPRTRSTPFHPGRASR